MTDAIKKREKAAINFAVYYRNYRRARDRALVKLAHKYPEEYKELFEMELKADEEQGKKWTDLGGNTNVPTNLNTLAGAASSAGNLRSHADPGEDEGDDL